MPKFAVTAIVNGKTEVIDVNAKTEAQARAHVADVKGKDADGKSVVVKVTAAQKVKD